MLSFLLISDILLINIAVSIRLKMKEFAIKYADEKMLLKMFNLKIKLYLRTR